MNENGLPEFGMHAYLEERERRVEVEWIGEGRDGDFDPNDPADYPHLRFNVLERLDDAWEQMDGASYCCEIDARSSDEIKAAFLTIILEEVGSETHVKRICERLSWTSSDDVAARMDASAPRI